eukprot:82076_1
MILKLFVNIQKQLNFIKVQLMKIKNIIHIYQQKQFIIYIIVKKLSKTEGKIDDNLLQLLEESWQNATLDDDKYKEVRQNWVVYGDVEEQLLGASECALELAQCHQTDPTIYWNLTEIYN